MDTIAHYLELYLRYPAFLAQWAAFDWVPIAIWLGIGAVLIFVLAKLKWNFVKKFWIAAWFLPAIGHVFDDVAVPWPLGLIGVTELVNHVVLLGCLIVNLLIVFSFAAVITRIRRWRRGSNATSPEPT